MTDFTTDQIQHLLDQAAPGPWEYEPGDGPDERYIGGPDVWGMCRGMCIGVEANGAGSSCSDDDLNLAAHAPELAEELIRLREHIEGLIIAMEVKAATGESQSPAVIAGYLKEIVLGEHCE